MNAKVKEEVILRILVQESLNLELWLKIYEELKFRGLFHEFFYVMDIFGIIFQKLGV
jgi:D-hexose-6-phosphate mutarotase